ncbi:MAG: hypothetical protein IKK17_00980 [Oscillospiraceae bacterium]|nr:hypothetical protein [Oscillospiraceae bacterium]
MKSIYRSIFTMLTVLICTATLTMSVFASSGSDDLAQRGYPEEYVSSLNDAQKDTLEVVAEDNDLVYLGTKLITDEDQGVGMALVYSGVMREENGTSYIDRVFVTVDYQWSAVPEDRGRDTITVVIGDVGLHVGDYFSAVDYMLDARGEWVSGKTAHEPHLRSERDMTYHANIKFGGAKTEEIDALCGTAYFDLIPTEPIAYQSELGFSADVNAYYNHIIPEHSILQTEGPLAAAKWLLLVFGVFAAYAVVGLLWEKGWDSDSKLVRIAAVIAALMGIAFCIYRYHVIGLLLSTVAGFFLYQKFKN